MGKPRVPVNEPRPLSSADILPNESDTSHRRAAQAVGARSEIKSRSPLAERANASPIPIPVRPSEPERNPQSRSAGVHFGLTEPNIRSQLDAVVSVTRSTARSGATSIPVSSFVARVATRGNSSPLSPPVRAPEVRVLLCTDKPENEAEQAINGNDIKYFKEACKVNIPSLEEKNIRTNLFGKEVFTDISTNFCWFFNPDDTVPGDMLILLVTGHGYLDKTTGIVNLKLFTSGGTQIDTTVLNTAISKLPGHCTLEVVMGTCYAEGMVSGLHRIEVMGANSSNTSVKGSAARSRYGSPSAAIVGPGRSNPTVLVGEPVVREDEPRSATLLSRLGGLISPRTSFPGLQLNAKATVIFWAAAPATGETFTEVLLPSRKRKRKHQLSVMIGAIYRACGPGESKITRRQVCAKIRKANLIQDQARLQYYASNPGVPMPAGADMPGMAMLLCSDDNRERVLDSPIFQPLDPPPLQKSLVAGSPDGVADEE